MKTRPFSAALIAGSVPVNVMFASAVPSPEVNASPPMPPSVIDAVRGAEGDLDRRAARVDVGDRDLVAAGRR